MNYQNSNNKQQTGESDQMQVYKRIALLGATANPNIGDEAILTANIQKIRKMYGDNCKIYVFTKDATYTSIYNGEYGQIIAIDYIHKFALSCNYDATVMKTRMSDLINCYSSNSISEIEVESIHNVFKDIDVLQIVGGGYLNTMWPDMLYEVFIATTLCRKYGKKYFLTGISTYPFDNKYISILQEIFDYAEFVDFRDDSYLELNLENNANIFRSLDDAISLEDYYRDKESEEYATILFHEWKGNSKSIISAVQNTLIPFMEKCLKEKIVKKFVILGFSVGDLDIWKNIKFPDGILPHIVYQECYLKSSIQAKHIVANAKFNIGSRFHQAVFSLSSNIAVLSIYYDEYYKNKLKSIHDLFGSRQFISIDELDSNILETFLKSVQEERRIVNKNNQIACKQLEKDKRICNVYGINDTDKLVLLKRISKEKNIPKISVIIPIYNMDAYLRECLDSVLSQTLKEIEIICINDGSTEYTQLILEEYSWKDLRIKVISQSNHGVAYARNVAIESASGEFLYFLDPDDWLPDDNVFADMYNAAKKNHVLVCGGSFEEYSSHGVVKAWDGNLSKYTFKKDEIVKYSEYQFDYGWVRFIYDRDFIIQKNLRIPSLKFFEDPVFFVRVMHEAKQFYAMKRYTYCYRTGHKPSEIPYEKVVDLMTGLYMNIEFAKEHNYWQLLELEIARIENDYANFICKYLLKHECTELRSIFEKLNQLLQDDNEKIEYRLYNKQIKNKEAEIWRLRQKIEQKEMDSVNEINRIRQEFYNSTTWKVGDIILFIPKMIKKICGGQ